jgi:hypothetical protein
LCGPAQVTSPASPAHPHIPTPASIGLRIFSKFGLFELKPVTWTQILPLAACYALCTPLSNLSLAFNSVGFYQMMKILTTPYVAFVEATFYGAKFSNPIKLSLLIVTVGVLMASVTDVQVCGGPLNVAGLCQLLCPLSLSPAAAAAAAATTASATAAATGAAVATTVCHRCCCHRCCCCNS